MKMPVEPVFVAVDVGNSRLRIGSFSATASVGRLPEAEWQNALLHAQLDAPDWLDDISSQLGDSATPWFVASVHRPRTAWLEQTLQRVRPGDTLTQLTHQQMNIEVALPRPEKVGIDRLAAAVAVNQLRQPGRAAIVIDSGSAVTVDLVDQDGRFCGGAIFPGQRMAASALARQTDLLPEVRIPARPPVVGEGTEEAIASGVYWGTVGAVRELVERMTAELQAEVELYLTGGGIEWRDEFSGKVHCQPDLVLAGIALAVGQRNQLQQDEERS